MFAARQRNPDPFAAVIGEPFKTANFLTKLQGHAVLPYWVDQRIDNLVIDESEQAWPFIDNGNAHAQRGEDLAVFQPDDTGANDDDGAGQFLEVQNVVAGENLLAVELDMGILCRLRADGDDHLIGGDIPMPMPIQTRSPHRMRIDKGAFGLQQIDPIAL